MRIINICSGKGGAGKTSIALNLAAALASLNKRVAVVDMNLTTSHLGVMLDMYSGRTINDFLRKDSKLEDAVRRHQSGISVVPAALELENLDGIDAENLKAKLKDVFGFYDFVLLDSAPGVGREALMALKACDEALFVANPYVPSVVDILKTKNLAGAIGFHNSGVVLNRVRGREYELTESDVFSFTELPVMGIIPEDEALLAATNERKIPFFSYPRSPSSRAFFRLAHKIAGLPYYDYRR